MKNNGLSLFLSIVALVLSLIVFIVHINHHKEAKKSEAVSKPKPLKIAYVNIDTLLNNYDLYNILMLQLSKKQDEYQKKLNSKLLSIQRRSYQLQQKYSQHLITTATYQSEAQKLLNEQDKLNQWQQQKALELQNDQAAISARVYDSILVAVNEFNADKRYDLIFSNNYTATGRTLLYGDKGLDITDTIVEILNTKHNISQSDSTSAVSK